MRNRIYGPQLMRVDQYFQLNEDRYGQGRGIRLVGEGGPVDISSINDVLVLVKANRDLGESVATKRAFDWIIANANHTVDFMNASLMSFLEDASGEFADDAALRRLIDEAGMEGWLKNQVWLASFYDAGDTDRYDAFWEQLRIVP